MSETMTMAVFLLLGAGAAVALIVLGRQTGDRALPVTGWVMLALAAAAAVVLLR